MLKEYLVLGKGIQMLDDGLTEEDNKVIQEKKEKMKFHMDKDFLGVCRICGLYVRADDRHFYFENKNAKGQWYVDVAHSRCC